MRTKTTRKFFSILLALALVFTLAPATAFAAPVNLDDLLGEWEGRFQWRAWGDAREADPANAALRIYREGGSHKAHFAASCPGSGRDISFTYTLTAGPDGTIAGSDAAWIVRGADNVNLSASPVFTFDGTVIRGERENTYFNRKPASSQFVPPPREATGVIRVFLNGQQLTFDVDPQIMNGRTMVPLRAVFEAMGATVEWNGGTQTATATRGNTVVALTIGSTSPTVNGRVVAIDQPAVIVDGRTLAPLRFVAEAFGGTVEWDGGTQTATITY